MTSRRELQYYPTHLLLAELHPNIAIDLKQAPFRYSSYVNSPMLLQTTLRGMCSMSCSIFPNSLCSHRSLKRMPPNPAALFLLLSTSYTITGRIFPSTPRMLKLTRAKYLSILHLSLIAPSLLPSVFWNASGAM